MDTDIRTFLAFDLGATSGRAILGRIENGSGISLEEVYRFPNSIQEIGGKYYWNVYSIFEHLKEALSVVSKQGIHIDSIGIDTWGVDFGYIADDGTLLGLPRSYRDPYTEGIPEKVFSLVPRKALYDATGIQIMNFNSLFQLVAAKKENFAPLRHAADILFMPDLFSYFFTGEMVCEFTDASTSQMLNPRTGRFETSLLSLLGIDPSILRKIVQPGTFVGYLRKEILDETGLKGNIPVVTVAGHDTGSAIVAVPASDHNFAYLSSGTWSLMGIESERPIISDKSCEFNFTNEGGIEGTTRFLKNITGMWILEQCKKVWKASGKEYDYARMEEMARASTSFGSVIDPDDPVFSNPEDMVEAISGYVRRTGQKAPETDGEMIYCIYHSLANKYKDVLEMLRGFATFEINKLHIIGGGSANSFMNQLAADIIGIPVVAGPKEATAIGNIMVQAKAAGLYKDRWEIRKAVADSFKVRTFIPRSL